MITLANRLRGSIKDMLRFGSGVCEDAAAAMEDALRVIEASPSAPAPRQDDLQVSHEKGPDFDTKWFAGGVTAVAHRGDCLTISFAHGGEIHISNPVVYVAPEQH